MKGVKNLTNTEALRKKIDDAGYKLSFVAQKCNLTYQGFMNKVNNVTSFLASEIMVLRDLLHLTDAEIITIFFSTEDD